jgi:hypothetical protein
VGNGRQRWSFSDYFKGENNMEILDEDEPRVAATSDVKPGDEVGYIPHKIHALKKDASGEYPWVIGRLARDSTPAKKTVEILEGEQLSLFLASVKRRADHIAKSSPNQQEPTQATEELGRQIIFVRPARIWKAIVRAVHPDGSADLDVHGANSAVTLHDNRVPRDQTGQTPHSFHVGEPTKK